MHSMQIIQQHYHYTIKGKVKGISEENVDEVDVMICL